MASAKNMSLLKDVKAYKIGWPVRVRLPHPWKQNTRSGGETLEFITADETGVKIHASCKRTQMYMRYSWELTGRGSVGNNIWTLVSCSNSSSSTGS
ncbi:unnamed protein product [Brassica oleracea var. botrytis]